MGMFKGNFLQVLNKWTWNIGNSIVGTYLGDFYNVIGKVDGVTHMDGMLALSGATSGQKAMTYGHISLGPKGYSATWKDHLFVHEYGHYIQSQWLGPAYRLAIAYPSIISAWQYPNSHKKHWYERSASKLGAEHFDKHYGSEAKGYTKNNPNYFDIESFRTGSYSPYINPRTSWPNDKSYPTATGDNKEERSTIYPL